MCHAIEILVFLLIEAIASFTITPLMCLVLKKIDSYFIKLPSDFEWNVCNMICMGVCQGRLRLSQLLDYYPARIASFLSSLKVWELKNYKSKKWPVEYDILLNKMTPETIELAEGNEKYVWNLPFHPDDPDRMYFSIRSIPHFVCVTYAAGH